MSLENIPTSGSDDLSAFEKAKKLKEEHNKEILEKNLTAAQIQQSADDRYLQKRKERGENILDQRKAIKEVTGYGSKEEREFFKENKEELLNDSERHLEKIKKEELELRKDTTQAKEEIGLRKEAEKKLGERIESLKKVWLGKEFSMDTVLVVIEQMPNRNYNGDPVWSNVLTTPEGLEEWKKYEKIWNEEVEPLKKQKEEAKGKWEKKRTASGIVFGEKAAKEKYFELEKELREKEDLASKHFRQFDSIRRDIENFAYDTTEGRSNIFRYKAKRNVVLDILRKNAGRPFLDSLDSFKEEIKKDIYQFTTNKFKQEERGNKKIDNLNKKLENQED